MIVIIVSLVLFWAFGAKGIGPLRSVLDWVPVQALAGQHNVSLFYHHGESLESAAYLDLWDQWRRAGIHVRPVQVRFSTLSLSTARLPLSSFSLRR